MQSLTTVALCLCLGALAHAGQYLPYPAALPRLVPHYYVRTIKEPATVFQPVQEQRESIVSGGGPAITVHNSFGGSVPYVNYWNHNSGPAGSTINSNIAATRIGNVNFNAENGARNQLLPSYFNGYTGEALINSNIASDQISNVNFVATTGNRLNDVTVQKDSGSTRPIIGSVARPVEVRFKEVPDAPKLEPMSIEFIQPAVYEYRTAPVTVEAVRTVPAASVEQVSSDALCNDENKQSIGLPAPSVETTFVSVPQEVYGVPLNK